SLTQRKQTFLLFFSTAATATEIYTLSLHDALPIYCSAAALSEPRRTSEPRAARQLIPNCWTGWPFNFRTGIGAENRLFVRSSHRSEEHTSELQSLRHLVCRLLLEKKKEKMNKSSSF